MRIPVYERLSMVVSFTLIGLTLYFIIDLPAQDFAFEILNRPLTFTISSRLLMVILLGGVAFTGAGAVIRAHPQLEIRYTVPFWVNATLIVVLATLVLAQSGSPINWAAGLLITGGLLWTTILAEYRALGNPDSLPGRLGRLWSQWMSYGLFLVYLILHQNTQSGAVIKIGAVFILAWLIALSIFKLHRPPPHPIIRYGFLVALGVVQLAGFLEFWALSPIGYGLITLLIFYTLCGILIAHFEGRLSRLLIIEYGLVSGVGLWLLARFVG